LWQLVVSFLFSLLAAVCQKRRRKIKTACFFPPLRAPWVERREGMQVYLQLLFKNTGIGRRRQQTAAAI
jgi:hypothetical protein